MKRINDPLNIVPSLLPEKDLAGGVCFKPRIDGTIIDVLVIHSCYVPESIRNADRELFAGQTGEAAFIAMRAKWKETNDTKYENAALLALLEGRFGSAGFEKYNLESIKSMFEFYGVSAHYVVDRSGKIFELVSPELLAFHAGPSKLPIDGRTSVSGFSIGIELLADEHDGYTESQLNALVNLSKELMLRFPIKTLCRHSDVAPERKTDPWGFDWDGYVREIRDSSMCP